MKRTDKAVVIIRGYRFEVPFTKLLKLSERLIVLNGGYTSAEETVAEWLMDTQKTQTLDMLTDDEWSNLITIIATNYEAWAHARDFIFDIGEGY